MMNIWEVIAAGFSIQAIFMALLLLFYKKGDTKANLIWSIFLILFSFNIFYNVLFWSEANLDLTRRLNFVYFIPLSLYGPLFYFYVKRMLTKKEIKNKEILLHLIPMFLVVVLFFRYYFLPLEYRDILDSKGQLKTYLPVDPKIMAYLLSIVLLMYGLFTYSYFKEHSVPNKSIKNWIKAICFCFLFFSISWASYYLLSYLNLIIKEYDVALTFAMILFVILTTFFGYIHPEIFNGMTIKEALLISKYEKSGLSKSLSYDYKEKLLNYVNTEKPFINNNLTLNDLSEAMRISKHHMSQIINEHFNMGFYDFINKQRIEEAVKILEDPSVQLNITETAYHCGFNNKVSFYKAFKKFTGTVPTDYLNRSIAH